MDNITWTCHICREERPDNKISVRSKPVIVLGVEIGQNIRYCNDRPECKKGTDWFNFVTPDNEVEANG